MSDIKQLNWLYALYQMGQARTLIESGEIKPSVQKMILSYIAEHFAADIGLLALQDGNGFRQSATYGLSNGQELQASSHLIKLAKEVIANTKPLMIEHAALTNEGWYQEEGEPEFSSGLMGWHLQISEDVSGAILIKRNIGKPSFNKENLNQGAVLTGLLSIVIQTAIVVEHNQVYETEYFFKRPQDKSNNPQFEREIFQDDDRLNSILSSLDDVVWSIETNNFRTSYMSPAAIKVYGRDPDEFHADPSLWLEIVHTEDREHVLTEMSNLYTNGVLDFDYRINTPDGKTKWVHDHVSVIMDHENKPLRLDGITRDITKQIEAEASMQKANHDLNEAYNELQTLQSQLLQSEKMASIGQLAAGVAHEINNPIGYVYSNLGSLERYLDDIFLVLDVYQQSEKYLAANEKVLASIRSAKAKADIDFLKDDISSLVTESREGITRVKKIVQDLKDFSHPEVEEEWQHADIIKGIESTLNIVNNEIKYNAEIVRDYAEIPQIECIPAQLNQVFMNLFVNASHAMEQKGTITIKVYAAAKNVIVEVSDTGKGIADEHLNRIFDPFFTTKPVGSGTGLGLSVSYNIIKKHHGTINVASEVGVGTTFHIALPIKQVLEAQQPMAVH